MTIREMRESLRMTQIEFGKRYGIPLRTIQNWESGERRCPEYTRALLERAVRDDMTD